MSGIFDDAIFDGVIFDTGEAAIPRPTRTKKKSYTTTRYLPARSKR